MLQRWIKTHTSLPAVFDAQCMGLPSVCGRVFINSFSSDSMPKSSKSISIWLLSLISLFYSLRFLRPVLSLSFFRHETWIQVDVLYYAMFVCSDLHFTCSYVYAMRACLLHASGRRVDSTRKMFPAWYSIFQKLSWNRLVDRCLLVSHSYVSLCFVVCWVCGFILVLKCCLRAATKL